MKPQRPTKMILLPVLAVTALALACAPKDSQATALRSLIATEREFSLASASHGMKVAFLRYLDDDAILFRPHPVNGKEYTALRPDPGVNLTWEPTRAGVASSGDLGWTTGPYRVAADEAGHPPFHGYFVSIWKRQETGRWKVVMDLGIENPADQTCPEQAELTLRPSGGGGERAAITVEALLELEKTLAARASMEDAALAYGAVLCERTRLYRDGHCPARDAAGVGQLLRSLPGKLSWEPLDASVSAAGDLAYSYGSYRLAPLEGQTALEQGYYMRIWEPGAEGFELVVEVTSPVPPEDE